MVTQTTSHTIAAKLFSKAAQGELKKSTPVHMSLFLQSRYSSVTLVVGWMVMHAKPVIKVGSTRNMKLKNLSQVEGHHGQSISLFNALYRKTICSSSFKGG